MIRKCNNVPEGALILGANKYCCAEGLENQNTLLVARSGAGKTRNIIIPSLLMADGQSSYVVTDPKGRLAKLLSSFYMSQGYNVVHLNFRNGTESSHFNPLSHIRTSDDIIKIAYSIIHCDDETPTDAYWNNASQQLLAAIIGYVIECPAIPAEQKTMNKVQELLPLCTYNRFKKEDGHAFNNKMDILMYEHQRKMKAKGNESWAAAEFAKVGATTPEKTLNTILSCIYAKLAAYNGDGVRSLLSSNDIDFRALVDSPSILFVEISDTDLSLSPLVSIFYTMMIQNLFAYADSLPNGSLPRPVKCFFDDFNFYEIPNFTCTLANSRSRNVQFLLAVQDLSNLNAYGKDAPSIVTNCENVVFMGAGLDTSSVFAKWANKPLHEMMTLNKEAYLFQASKKPERIDLIDLDDLMLQRGVLFAKEHANEPEIPKEV